MPYRYICFDIRCWWSRKSLLEQILIISMVIAITVIAILCCKMTKPIDGQVSDVCNSTVCINAASRLLRFINPEVDPCENFYEFACGTFLKNAHRDANLAVVPSIHSQKQRALLDLYIEDIQSSDHKMVQFSKKLFKACMDEVAIDRDDLNTINNALKQVGGWPVVEGDNWDENNFDLIQTTIKLRELGYTFSVFFDLSIKWNENIKHLCLHISLPNSHNPRIIKSIDSSHDPWFVEIMTETAMLFGAKDRDNAEKEMKDLYDFMQQIEDYFYIFPDEFTTVKSLQKRHPGVNWLKFINKVIRSRAVVQEDDIIFAPHTHTLTGWLDTILNERKRVIANYMVWTVVLNALPYISERFQLILKRGMQLQPRTIFCMEEIEKRFDPSPIDIMYDRKYLPETKRKMMENILLNVKLEYIKYIQGANWMDPKDKPEIINTANNLNIMAGKEENYFENQILDGLEVDTIDFENQTFLNLISQANRNYYTRMFNEIIQSYNQQHLRYVYATNGVYRKISSAVLVPTSFVINGIGLEEGKPNYLYYGGIRFPFMDVLAIQTDLYNYYDPFNEIEQWSTATRENYSSKIDCIEDMMINYQMNTSDLGAKLVFFKVISEQVYYSAYNEWVKSNGEEHKLIGLNYTPRQLLWISGTTNYCFPSNKYSDVAPFVKRYPEIYSDIITASLVDIPEFAKDFNCPTGSKMNPIVKCRIR